MQNLDSIISNARYAYRAEHTVANVTTVVNADDELAISCFESYLPTRFTRSFDVSGRFDISYVQDPALESELRARADELAEFFWIKVDVCLKRFRLGELTVFVSHIDEITNEDYVILSKGQQYWVIYRHMTERIARVAVRLLREILLRQLENIGGCFCHAAAVASSGGGKGLLIIGDSGAGKSTSTWQLCRTGSFNYISNDKSILVWSGQRMNVVCWPLSVRLGIGTLQSSGKLDAYRSQGQLRAQESSLWTQPVADAEQMKKNWGNKVKLSLTPRELYRYENIHSDVSCQVGAVLIPKLEIGSGSLTVARTDFAEHRALIERNLLEPWDEDIGRGWLDLRQVSDDFLTQRKTDLLDRLAQLPSYELTGDPQSFERSIDPIVTELQRAC